MTTLDDDEIRTTIRTLAEGRPTPADARTRISDRIRAKRRQRGVGMGLGALPVVTALTVVTAIAWGVWVSGEGQGALSPTTFGQPGNAVLTPRLSPWGFSVSMTVSFPDDRRLLSAVFEAGGKQYPVEFYPNDGTDNDVQPQPLPLAAGVTVLNSATLTPDCAATRTAAPVLVVTSRRNDGSLATDRFGTANPQRYVAAVRVWCSSSAKVTLSRASGQPDGDVRVVLKVVNPGPQPVTVTSGSYNVGGAHWTPASVTVRSGHVSTLVINATHTQCGSTQAPWLAGRLRSNGHLVRVYDGAQWC